MKMYEPDLAHVKRRLSDTPPQAPLHTSSVVASPMPKALPPRMIECGYRLDRNVLYFGNLPMSEMSAKGILKQFKEWID